MGYEFIPGRVESRDIEKFLSRLKVAGIDSDEVVTDGSPIYPKVLKEFWPTTAHQLCLFHESSLVTAEIYEALMSLRKGIPKPSPVTQRVSLKGLPCTQVRVGFGYGGEEAPCLDLPQPYRNRAGTRRYATDKATPLDHRKPHK